LKVAPIAAAASSSTNAGQSAGPSDSYEIVGAVPESVRPLEGRARWTVIALAAVVVADVLAIGSDWLEVDLMNRVLDGEDVALSELDSNDNRQAGAAVLVLAAYLVAVVFFIRWFHAAYANLRALGRADLRFGTGWAIGAWFVPFLNLWRPKQIANDIWRGSDPRTRAQDATWKDGAVPTFVDLWWAAWIVATFVGNFAFRAWFRTDTAEEIRTATYADIASLVLDVVAAALAIVVVRRLTARQGERVRRLPLTEGAGATMQPA
jgi:hypothetical protein